MLIKKMAAIILTLIMCLWLNASAYAEVGYTEVIPFNYDAAYSFSDDMAMVCLSGKWGYIDKSGNTIVPFKYYADPGGYAAGSASFCEGFAAVCLDGKFGFVDKSGREIVSPKYDYADSFSEGMAIVVLGDWQNPKYGFVDKSGNEVVPLKYDSASRFTESIAKVSQNGKYGFIDKSGNEITPIKYDSVESFSEGMAMVAVSDGVLERYFSGKCGFIDKSGKEVVPLKYGGAKSFSNGLAAVSLGGKCGFIDKLGNEIVPIEFGYMSYMGTGDILQPFSEGLAAVRFDNKWGYIALTNDTPQIIQSHVQSAKATPTAANVYINGIQVYFDAYNISDTNYFKLRDLAYALTGTAKQFEVTFNDITNSIMLTSNKPYTIAGGEMARGDGQAKDATPTTSKVLKDGQEISLTAYNIGGNNYFKLRDIGIASDFATDWDGGRGAIVIDTSRPYGSVADGRVTNAQGANINIQHKTIAAGSNYSLATKADNSLWTWGDDFLGQLGVSTSENKKVPVKIMDSVAFVSAGADHAFAIKTDNSLWGWGNSWYGQLGNGKNNADNWASAENMVRSPIKIMDSVSMVSAGASYTMAIKTDGSLWAWGSNWSGQLGSGTNTTYDNDNHKYEPVKIMDSVVYVSAGTVGHYMGMNNEGGNGAHTMAIKTDGSLWAWGSNEYGQLGDGTVDTFDNYGNVINAKSTPIKIMDSVKLASAGARYSMAIKADGSLWAWGLNRYGQLGDGTSENRATPVKIMDSVVSVSAGQMCTMAIKTDGSLWAWGSNEYGQLGDGTTTNRYVPVKIMDSVVSVSAGILTQPAMTSRGPFGSHSMALKSDGTLWVWGQNWFSQIGDGTRTEFDWDSRKVVTDNDKYIPVRIMDGISMK